MNKHRINEIMKNIIISILFYVSMRQANLTLGANPIGPMSSFMPPHKIAGTILVIGCTDCLLNDE